MTAQQVKELTLKFVLQSTQGEYQQIIKTIAEHANKGAFQITTQTLSETVKARLIADGYDVKYSAGDQRDFRDSPFYTISWK